MVTSGDETCHFNNSWMMIIITINEDFFCHLVLLYIALSRMNIYSTDLMALVNENQLIYLVIIL
jgi:hypothetical protein